MAMTELDYAEMLAALLPHGPAWPRDPDSTLHKFLSVNASELARADLRIDDLIDECDPRTVNELLTDWERNYGLPDPCVTAPQTIEERRAALIGRVVNSGGQSREFFLALAASLGDPDSSIEEIRPATCESTCEAQLFDDPWRFVWRLVIPNRPNVHSYFRAGSRCGDRVDAYAKGALECHFQRLRPAHTYVWFKYEGP